MSAKLLAEITTALEEPIDDIGPALDVNSIITHLRNEIAVSAQRLATAQATNDALGIALEERTRQAQSLHALLKKVAK